jgi:hypothetical protein
MSPPLTNNDKTKRENITLVPSHADGFTTARRNCVKKSDRWSIVFYGSVALVKHRAAVLVQCEAVNSNKTQ